MSNLSSDSPDVDYRSDVQEGREEIEHNSHQTARELGIVGYGLLAFQMDGIKRPVEVLQSGAGFYLGTLCEEGPCTRESARYWFTRKEAEEALSSGLWMQCENLF